MQINQFNGGLATRIDPSLIGPAYAILCNNVDTSAVVLKSAKDIVDMGTAMEQYFYKFKGAYQSSAGYRDYLEYRNTLYYTEPSSFPKKFKDGLTSSLGIAAPIAVPATDDDGNPIYDQAGVQYKGIVPIVSDFDLDDIIYTFTTSTTTGGNIAAGTYNYRIGVVQNNVVVRYIDAPVTIGGTGNITLTIQPLGGLSVRVYREFNNVYRLLGQVQLNEVRVITDSVLDISSAASFFSIADLSVAFSNPGGGNLTPLVYNYRFAYTVNSQVFSYVDMPYTVPTTGSVRMTFDSLGGVRVQIYREYASTYRYVGAVTLSEDNTIFTDSVLDISANSAFVQNDITYGVIQYTVTFFNENTGVESAPMAFSNELTVALGKRIEVTRIPLATDPQVTHRRIYRLGGNLTQMTLIKELDDNTTTSFFDYTDDVSGTRVLESYSNLPPPAAAKYLVETYGFLFAADGPDLVFSAQGFPEYWPASNRINFDAEITGLLPVPQGLLVSTKYKMWLLVGTQEGDFSKLKVSDEQGCINHRTFRLVKTVPVWMSLDGYCSLSNGLVSVISKDLLGKIALDVVDCIVYDEMYILALANGTIHMFDARFTSNFTTYSLSKGIIGLGVFDNILQAVTADKRLVQLFAGTSLSFTYKTGALTDQQHTETKLYNNIYVRLNGEVELKVYIDGQLVHTEELSGNMIKDVTPPAETQRGSAIQLELTGVGTVYEIEFKPVGRQNGR